MKQEICNGQADNTLDLLTNKNSNLLFYQVNDFLTRVNIPSKTVRHSKIANDDVALEIIQSQNWQYFIGRIFDVCKSSNIGNKINYSKSKLAIFHRKNIRRL